jgi:hypothetical protein
MKSMRIFRPHDSNSSWVLRVSAAVCNKFTVLLTALGRCWVNRPITCPTLDVSSNTTMFLYCSLAVVRNLLYLRAQRVITCPPASVANQDGRYFSLNPPSTVAATFGTLRAIDLRFDRNFPNLTRMLR